MERMNNAIADPAINPTMNDLETGRRLSEARNQSLGRRLWVVGSHAASIALNNKRWLVAVAK
jgi:hypothetical protein